MMKKTLFAAMISAGLIGAPAAMACGGANSGKHMGEIVAINDASFTIRDAETGSPKTFAANAEIINGIQKVSGAVMVNYEETDEGALQAVGVTPL